MAETKEMQARPSGEVVTLGAESLISQAIEKGAGIDTIERLMELRSKLKAEQAREMFFQDLADLQRRLPVIAKRKKADRYMYAPLEDIIEQTRDLIANHGFSYRWEFEQSDRAIIVTCVVSHRLGHTERTSASMPIDSQARINAAQQVGSASTYGRRYTLCGAFGIATGDDDDDAQSLSKPGRTEPNSGAPPRARGPSDAQLKRLFAISREHGWSKEEVRDLLDVEFGIESTSDLSRAQYDRLCDELLPAGPQ